MVGFVFDIANERLPRTPSVAPHNAYPESSIHWEKFTGEVCSRDQWETLILEKLGGYLDWSRAKYDYPAIDDRHQAEVYQSIDYPQESFLASKVYQSWKTRRTRGPGLLCAIGSGTSHLFLEQIFLKLRMNLLRSVTDRISAMTGKTTLWYVFSMPAFHH